MPCDHLGSNDLGRDFRVLRAVIAACAGLQQLRIHALTSMYHSIKTDPRCRRDMFHGIDGCSCLPQSLLRRLELSAAPGDINLGCVYNNDSTRFPSLAWLSELVLQSRHISVRQPGDVYRWTELLVECFLI